jgi:hypothetical protein
MAGPDINLLRSLERAYPTVSSYDLCLSPVVVFVGSFASKASGPMAHGRGDIALALCLYCALNTMLTVLNKLVLEKVVHFIYAARQSAEKDDQGWISLSPHGPTRLGHLARV